MKKTVLLAATATLSAGLIGLAAAASASGPSSSGSGGVSSTSSSSTVQRASHGADDPATHDVGDDRGSGGHRADDVPARTTVSIPVPAPAAAAAPAPVASSRNGTDDPVTHDVGDDNGSGRHGADR